MMPASPDALARSHQHPTYRAGPLAALLLAISVAVTTSHPASAGVDRWSGAGPPGGRVTGLSLDPGNPAVLVASLLGGGVFKSRDGGSSWRSTSRGLAALDLLALVRDASDPGVLYAGSFTGGVFKSGDGGESWEPFGEGLAGLNLKTLLAAADGVVYAGTSQGVVLRRGPGQARWRPTGQALGIPVFFLAASPANPRLLLAGTADGLFRTADGGDTWMPSDAGLPSPFVKFVGFSPGDPQTAWAGTSAGLAASSDGGHSWRRSGEGLPQAEIRSLVFDPHEPRILHAAGAAGVFSSRDGGRTWTDRSTGLPQREVHTLRRTSRRLWAALAGAGVVWSDDEARSWHRGNQGLDATSVSHLVVAAAGPETVWAGTAGRGVVTGVAGEPTWRLPPSAPSDAPVHALVALPPAASSAVLIASFAAAGLFRSTDGGLTWSTADDSLPPAPVVALDGSREIVYAALAGAGVFASRDQGSRWEATAPLPDVAVRDLAVAPSDPQILWAAATPGVFHSTDGGATWRDAGPGPAAGVRTLAVDPTDPGTVWAGTFAAGALLTHDAGVHWEAVSDGLGSPEVRALAVDPFGSGTVAAATAAGVFLHRGAGPWETAAPGLPTPDVLAVVADPRVPGRWWAATNGRGVFVLDDAGAAALSLHDGRFEARAAWRDLGGHGGAAAPLPLTRTSGAFRAFDGAPDLALKLLDGRAVNGHFWLFAAPLTGAGMTLTVSDGETGDSRTWDLPPGGRRQVVDLEAF